jgi:hypothetical protein
MAEEKPKGFSVVDRRVETADQESGPGPAANAATGKATPATGSPQPPPPEPEPTRQAVPPVSFPTFLLSLHAGAMIHLGLVPNPADQQVRVELELARENIDLLEVLQQKTKGNLTLDESRLLDNVLYELRMLYLQVCESSGKKECSV